VVVVLLPQVKSPIVLGVRVVEGVARIGTPICIPSKQFLFIGKITGIQKNHTDFQEAKKGEEFGQWRERTRALHVLLRSAFSPS
jgi:translation initiation factor IF-2